MKRLKLMAMLLAAGLSLSITTSANAEVGYLDYQKVLETRLHILNGIRNRSTQ